MSEIKINIQEAYLPAFLEFLQTLSYVKVKEVAGVAVKQNGAAMDSALRNLPANDLLRKAIIPMRKS